MNVINLVMVFLLLFPGNGWCQSLAPAEVEQQVLDRAAIDNLNQFIERVNYELAEDLPSLTFPYIKELAANGLHVDWEMLRRLLLNSLCKEFVANTHLMGKLVFLSVVCAVLQNLQNSFEQATISLLAHSVCFIFMTVIVLVSFSNAVTLASQTVGYMVGFMEALLPLLLSLLAGVGALTTLTLFTPLMLFVVTSISLVVKDIVLPLLLLTAILDCLNFLSDKYRLCNLAVLLKQAGMMILGFVMVLFIGVITIQGAIGSVADGLALRTAKYATATLIPVVGKVLADTVELVAGASLLIKNAVGIFGIIIVAMLCLLPLLKLISLILVIKVAGALIEPMGDEKMAKCLASIGNNLVYVLGAVIIVALMFFLTITMMIAAGNATLLIR